MVNRAAPDLVHLRASGVSVVIDLGEDRLPRILHWGRDLGDLSEADLAAVRAVSVPAQAAGAFDVTHQVAVLPEPSWGWQGTPGVAGSRDGRWHSQRFTLTGADVERSGHGDAAVQRVRAWAQDPVARLELTIDLELLGSGLLRARASLTSAADASTPPFALDQVAVLLPVPREATEVLDFAGRWTRERTPVRTPLTVGTRLRESRGGKPGHGSAFATAVGTAGFGFRRGEVWMVHVAWSGNTRQVVERGGDGFGVVGGGDLLLPGEVRLGPGERYDGPWVYGAYADAGLDDAAGRYHRHLRARPTHPRSPRPVVVNTWEAVYFDHSLPRLTALVDAAAAVGAERFVLDDGWFRRRRDDGTSLGDWFVDEEAYPDGLEPLLDHVRGRGLQFGLWVEPEMISPDSDLARAHPDWIAQPGGGRLPLEGRRQQVLDLTVPEAFAYIEGRLHDLVARVRPDFLKWDHNRDLLEAGSLASGRPTPRLQTLAFYRLLDSLRRTHPRLEIESCAGGGGRIDLEVLERTDRVWASDSNDPHERQQIQRWTQLLVPPELIGAHIGPPRAHTTHRASTLDFRAGTAIFGHLGIEWDVSGAEATRPEVRERIAAWVELYRRHRRLLHEGAVVNADLPEPGRLIHGVVSPDRREALFAVASLDTVSVNPVGPVRLPGLDRGLRYRVEQIAPDGDAVGRAMPPWLAAAGAVPGSLLADRGVQIPALAPDDVVLLHLTATG